jgi:hypothetical protein
MSTRFTPDHEWISIEEDHEAAVVGITLHAQDALGDVVFVDLPEVGRTLAKGDVAGVVESVKAAADLYMPVSGEIIEVMPASARAASARAAHAASRLPRPSSSLPAGAPGLRRTPPLAAFHHVRILPVAGRAREQVRIRLPPHRPGAA